MPEGWKWDSTLFLGSAPYYQRGRQPYAQSLPDVLREALHLDGRGRLLDVGCGPGILALILAHLFQDVVGVDADAGMIAEAERRAADAGLAGKTRWVRALAEDLSVDLGMFTVAVFGQSFHWMDRDLVASIIRTLLHDGGAFVHVADLKSEILDASGLPHPAVPQAAVDDLVKRYLGPVRRAGQGVLLYGSPSGEAAVLERAGFVDFQRYVVPGGAPAERGVEDIVARVFSMSSSAPHLFGGHREAFEADLGRLLLDASPSGLFSERLPSTEVFVWRKASAEN